MRRKVVRLTLDHLDGAHGAVPLLRVLAARPGPPRAGRTDGARPTRWTRGSRRCCATGARAGGWCWSTACRRGSRSTRPRRSCRAPRSFPTAPVSADAVLLTQVYVAPDARRGGLGRMLVQGMARDLIERGGIKAVEAFGDTRGDAGWDTHRRAARPPARQPVRGVGRVPGQRGLQDPPAARAHPADADGPALGADLARRGRGGPREADRRRPPGPEADAGRPETRRTGAGSGACGVRLRPR